MAQIIKVPQSTQAGSSGGGLKAQSIGIVKVAIGEVVAVNPSGVVCRLLPGDKVFPNDIIQTGDLGSVQIEFSNGQMAGLGRESSLLLDTDIFDPSKVQTAGNEVSRVQDLIASGADPTQVTEASAAGGVQEDQRHGIVEVEQSMNSGINTGHNGVSGRQFTTDVQVGYNTSGPQGHGGSSSGDGSSTPFVPGHTTTAADTTPPANPTITISSLTNDNTPTITGTAEPGSTVRVEVHSTPQYFTTVAGADGKWSIQVPENAQHFLEDGKHTVTAQAIDAAGNSSGSVVVTFAVDTVAGPVIIATSGATNDSTPEIKGSAEAGSTIVVTLNGAETYTTTAGADGAWSVTPAGLGDGTYTVSAQETDAAGNVNNATSVIVVDTVAPIASTIALTTATDTGTSHTDRITNDSTPTITGTAEAGSKVTVVISHGTEQVGPTLTATVGADGTWNVTPKADLASGNYTVAAITTDAAGNSTTATQTVVIDTVAPTVAITSTGGLTSHAAQTIEGTGDAGATVKVYDGNTQVGSATVGANGTWSASVTLDMTVPGTHTLTASSTDAAGNTGTSNVAFNLDTVAPTVAITSINSDTGSNTHDFITKDTSLIFNGTAEKGASVEVQLDGKVIGTVIATDGTWKLDYTTKTISVDKGGDDRGHHADGHDENTVTTVTNNLNEGSYVLTATATDAAGNTTTATQKMTIDTTIATPTAALTHDTGASGSDKITNDAGLTLSGTASDVARSYVVDNGAASTSYTAPLNGGSHTVKVIDTDTAGNTANASITFNLDKTIAAPTVTLTHDTGASGSDKITNDAGLTLSGTASDVTHSYVVDNGAASTSYTAPLNDGSHTVKVIDTDTAGNTANASITFNLDRTVPIATAIEVADTALKAGETSQVTITFSEKVSGFSNADLTVANGTLSAVTSSDDGKTWTATLTPTSDTTDTTNVITLANSGVADLAGNVGNGITSSNNYTVDTTPAIATHEVTSKEHSDGSSHGSNDILGSSDHDHVLSGSSGSDTFRFSAGDHGDTISNFNVDATAGGHKGDVLDLHDILGQGGILSFHSVAHDGDKTTVSLSIDPDGNGHQAPVQLATITMTGLGHDTTAADIMKTLLDNHELKL